MELLYIGLALLALVIIAAVVWMWPKKQKFEVVTPGEKKLLLVYAPWCGHCKSLMPIWDTVKGVKTEKINGDENPKLVEELKVKGYPSIFLVKPDGDVEEYSGNRDKESIEAFGSK